MDHLKLSSLTCNRPKAEFQTYVSFHASVTEQDFPSINNTGVWLNGCLIAPLYGRLNPGQIYSPEISDILVAVAPEKSVRIQKMMMGHTETALGVACDGCLSY
jgi:hypothetical protein